MRWHRFYLRRKPFLWSWNEGGRWLTLTYIGPNPECCPFHPRTLRIYLFGLVLLIEGKGGRLCRPGQG